MSFKLHFYNETPLTTVIYNWNKNKQHEQFVTYIFNHFDVNKPSLICQLDYSVIRTKIMICESNVCRKNSSNQTN